MSTPQAAMRRSTARRAARRMTAIRSLAFCREPYEPFLARLSGGAPPVCGPPRAPRAPQRDDAEKGRGLAVARAARAGAVSPTTTAWLASDHAPLVAAPWADVGLRAAGQAGTAAVWPPPVAAAPAP